MEVCDGGTKAIPGVPVRSVLIALVTRGETSILVDLRRPVCFSVFDRLPACWTGVDCLVPVPDVEEEAFDDATELDDNDDALV